MRWVIGAVGAIALLLGMLWLLQGTGLVVLDPIACVGECAALAGPSLPWAVAGAVLTLLGIGGLRVAIRRRP
jgi:hypothetical protein